MSTEERTKTLAKEDEQFLQAFEQCSLSGECWTHAAHVRMAWLQLERSSNFDEALHRIRKGIKTFNESRNNIGYHETITVAFAQVIHHRRQSGDKIRTWQEFLDRHHDLLSKESPILHVHYSPELLASDLARETFVEPDRLPLPIVG